MKNRSTVITIGLLMFVLIVAGVFTVLNKKSQQSESAENSNIQASLGDITFADLEGNEVRLDEFKGKTLVVTSWASWCPFCADELKDFAELAQEYADQEVVILAINRAEAPIQIEYYMQSLGDVGQLTFLADTEDVYYDFVGGYTMPETLFYNNKGDLVHHYRGVVNLDDMKRWLEAAKNDLK